MGIGVGRQQRRQQKLYKLYYMTVFTLIKLLYRAYYSHLLVFFLLSKIETLPLLKTLKQTDH